MTTDAAGATHVILLGAGSRSGRAIRAALAGHRVMGVARQAGEGVDAVTADYGAVPAGIEFAGAVVVNCVGSDRGDAATLDRLNHAVPRNWAAAAKAGGARQFIQISSLSVHGAAATVDVGTPLAPINDYGRSKLAAEKALAALAVPGFIVTLLRVPILVGAGEDKLAQLIRFVRKRGVVPFPRIPVARSMLSYGGLAAAVRRLIAVPVSGPVYAADPEPFTYDALLRSARSAGHKARAIRVPVMAEAAVRMAAPGIHRRLFASAVIAPEGNIAADALPFERVSDVLDREMREGARA